jgi:hypothetical protein
VCDRCDPHTLAEVGECVRGVEVVDRSSLLAEQAPLDGGLHESFRDLDDVDVKTSAERTPIAR